MDSLNDWKGRRVLVTGGTGFVGQHVLLQGLRMGVEVHNISLRNAAPQGVQQHHADLVDRERIFRILKEVQPSGIIHLAAAGVIYGANDLLHMFHVNVLGMDNLLAAVANAKVKPAVVVAGSGYEYAPQDRPIGEDDPVAPVSAYGVAKAAAALCANFYAARMPISLLRFFNIYGPGEREPRLVPYAVSCARTAKPLELTKGEQVRDYVYVEDAAESFWRVLSRPPQDQKLRVLNIGSGSPLSLKQFVMKLAGILRKKGLEPQIMFGARPYRTDEPMVYAADVARLQRTLKWLPSTDIETGLVRAVESML